MALKTFNLDEKVYKEFSEYCKKEGISMSKKIENYIKSEIEKFKIMKRIKSSAKKRTSVTEHSFSKYC